jgi:hypothetical protein
MTDTRLNSGGNVSIRFGLPGFAANWRKPTVAEVNATLDITQSVSFQDFSFGAQASNQLSDPAVSDTGNAQTRGFAQFSGSLSFFYPAEYDDATNPYSNTYDTFDSADVVGYLLIRVDGEVTPEGDFDANLGDFWNVYRVIADGWTDVVVGENAFRYTIEFLPQGDIATRVWVGTTPTITASVVGGATLAVGGKKPTLAYLTGRQLHTDGYSWGFRGSSDDTTIMTVDNNGVIHGIAAGTADLVFTHLPSGVSSTPIPVTVS